MNNRIGVNIGRFIVLILVQVLVLNNINFMGYINPYIYIIFILLFPLNVSRALFLFLSFLLGLTMDMFGDSGGVHAAACLVAAFIRPVILRTSFGISYEFQTVKFNNIGLGERILYVTLMVLSHHLVLFTLEIFNFSHILLLLKKTLFSSIFTIVICNLVLVLFQKKDS